MLSTSGNPLNTNNSTNTSNVNNSNSSNVQSTNKSNILSASSLINSEFMLPINNLTLNNPMATTSSYLNDYNKLYRDVGIFQQQQQQSKQQQQQQQNNLIGNNNLNNLVVNSLTSSLNNLGNHHQATNNLLNNLPTRHNLNGLPNHNLNNLQQQQSINNQPTPSKQQLMNNSEFMMRLNRCNACLEANIFETALDEINHAINLVNNSALARFRKAQALLGLKRFLECEKELWMCINLEPNVIDYRKELLKVKQLAIMHFNPNLDQNTALIAAQKYDSIKDACESLMWSAPNGLIDFNSFQTGNNAGQGNLTSQPNVNNQQQANAGNNLNENSLLSGWNLNLNTADANNRLINFNALSNQLVNNSNMLFSNNGNNLITNNLLLSNSNMINRSNNGTNNLTTNTSTNTGLGGVNNQPQQLKNQQQTATSTNSSVTSNQHSSPNQAASNSPLTNNEATLTNGLSNLPNGNNRFNYLLRGLDQTAATHLLNSNQQQQQSTNGQANSNNNQNLINNQQQLYNRIIPSFMDNQNDQTNKQQQQQQQHNLTTSATSGINNQAVLNCSRNLQSKLTLNDNSLINGTNGLLIMNNNLNNSAPSPICAKMNSAAPSNTSNPSNSNNNNSANLTGSNNLTNSCNYNIFNQMPEMKLIETIVPNLLNLGNASNLNSNTTGLTNNNLDNQTDLTTDSRKLLASIAKEVNNNIGKDGNNLVTNLVDNFTNAVSNSIVNNLQTQQSIKQMHQQQQQDDDCNKSANKKSTIGKLDLINDLNADKGGVIDLKSSNNSVTKDDLFSNAKDLDNQNSPNNLSTNSSGNLASVTSAAVSSQCTSYSDIVKRAKKITQATSTASSNGSTDLNNGTGSKPSNLTSSNKQDNEQNLDDSISSKRPTNLWAYNGLRVANVSLNASKQSLMNLFSKFGRIRLLERIINKTTTNNIWVYFDNPISPVDAVTKLQNVYIEGICADNEPLRLFFAPTDDQKDLKFSRPKQPPDNKGECYYWRTTNCFSKDQCPLLHIQANKNIDAQVWMRLLNPENAENKDGEEENNESTSSNNQTGENSANES